MTNSTFLAGRTSSKKIPGHSQMGGEEHGKWQLELPSPPQLGQQIQQRSVEWKTVTFPFPTKNGESRPHWKEASYLENPYLCNMVENNLYFLRSCVWFLSVVRRLGRKECRINRCPIVVMAAVPILGTKFAFGGPFGHLPQTPTLIGSLAYPVSSSSQSRCYLLGIQKGADGSVSVRHN